MNEIQKLRSFVSNTAAGIKYHHFWWFVCHKAKGTPVTLHPNESRLGGYESNANLSTRLMFPF